MKQYLYNAIDNCTRLQVALVRSQLPPQANLRFLRMVKKGHSLSPCVEASPFRASLAQSGIRHKLIPVGKPRQNGKVERSHRILDEECLNSKSFGKPRPRELAIKRWINFYNSQRPHSALQWSTPLHKLQSFDNLPECYPCLKSVQ